MATILEFPDRLGKAARKKRSTKQAAAGASAEIVIFPGVRIERWEEPKAQRKAGARQGNVNRDTLELLV